MKIESKEDEITRITLALGLIAVFSAVSFFVFTIFSPSLANFQQANMLVQVILLILGFIPLGSVFLFFLYVLLLSMNYSVPPINDRQYSHKKVAQIFYNWGITYTVRLAPELILSTAISIFFSTKLIEYKIISNDMFILVFAILGSVLYALGLLLWSLFCKFYWDEIKSD